MSAARCFGNGKRELAFGRRARTLGVSAARVFGRGFHRAYGDGPTCFGRVDRCTALGVERRVLAFRRWFSELGVGSLVE
jgi:hypothetical protein